MDELVGNICKYILDVRAKESLKAGAKGALQRVVNDMTGDVSLQGL